MLDHRAKEIVSLISSEYLDGKRIFKSVKDLLEYQIPLGVDYCSKEHARFYFFLIFNDHGTKSRSLYNKFKLLYKESPDIFSPKHISDNFDGNGSILKTKYLSNLGLRYPSQSAKSWITNSVILVNDYDAEPLSLFQSTADAVRLFKKIKCFRSYGPKTSGLLLRVIRGVGFNRKLHNLADVPLPVDIHDSRIAYMCGLYRPKGIDDIYKIYSNPKHISNIESIWRDAAHKINVRWEDIDRALWLLGSIGCVNRLCIDCPINKFCTVGRSVIDEKIDLFNYSSLQHRR